MEFEEETQEFGNYSKKLKYEGFYKKSQESNLSVEQTEFLNLPGNRTNQDIPKSTKYKIIGRKGVLGKGAGRPKFDLNGEIANQISQVYSEHFNMGKDPKALKQLVIGEYKRLAKVRCPSKQIIEALIDKCKSEITNKLTPKHTTSIEREISPLYDQNNHVNVGIHTTFANINEPSMHIQNQNNYPFQMTSTISAVSGSPIEQGGFQKQATFNYQNEHAQQFQSTSNLNYQPQKTNNQAGPFNGMRTYQPGIHISMTDQEKGGGHKIATFIPMEKDNHFENIKPSNSNHQSFQGQAGFPHGTSPYEGQINSSQQMQQPLQTMFSSNDQILKNQMSPQFFNFVKSGNQCYSLNSSEMLSSTNNSNFVQSRNQCYSLNSSEQFSTISHSFNLQEPQNSNFDDRGNQCDSLNPSEEQITSNHFLNQQSKNIVSDGQLTPVQYDPFNSSNNYESFEQQFMNYKDNSIFDENEQITTSFDSKFRFPSFQDCYEKISQKNNEQHQTQMQLFELPGKLQFYHQQQQK